MNFEDIITKWKSKKVFNAEADRFKEKVFILPQPIEMKMLGLDTPHLYPLVLADTHNRHDKMCGKNVMYSLMFNDCSFESYSFYHDHYLSSKELYDSVISSLDKIGIGYDVSKTFYFTMPNIIKYFQETFFTLFNDKIKLKKGNAYFDAIGLHMYNFYQVEQIDDKAYLRNTNEEVFLQTDEYLSLNIEPYFDEIKELIKKENISLKIKNDLYKMLGEYNFLETSFYNYKEHIQITVNLNEPELISGIGFFVLNPELIDVKNFISNDELETVTKYMENGYQEGVFSGSTVNNPLTGENIYIFISYDFDEAIHVAIPSMNERDAYYASIFGIDKKIVVENDRMIESDFLDGLSRLEARLKIINTFVGEGMGTLKSSFGVKEIILSSKENIGVIVPLIEQDRELGYTTIENIFLPIYFNNRGRIIITEEEKMNHQGEVIKLCFNDDYLYGLFHIACKKMGNEYFGMKDIEFNGENNYFVNSNNAFKEFLIPKIFELVLGIKNNDKYTFLDYEENKFEVISEYNSLRINFLEDILKSQSADAYRMFILSLDGESDFDKTKLKITKYEQYIDSINKIYHEDFIDDNYAFDQELYSLTQNLNVYLKDNNLKLYIEELIKFYFDHLINEKMTANQALTYLKLLSIVAPFITQRLYEEVFKQTYFLVYEEWPFLN